MALVYGIHLSWGDQDPGQQRCWNDLLPSMQMRPTLLSGPGNWKGVLAPPACGQGCRLTALPMDGNFTCRLVQLLNYCCALHGCEQRAGGGRTASWTALSICDDFRWHSSLKLEEALCLGNEGTPSWNTCSSSLGWGKLFPADSDKGNR